MRKSTLVLLAALAVPASAHPPYLAGTVGTAPVFVDLDRDGGKVSGWYYYLRVGKDIRLEGTIDAKGHFRIDESDYNTGKKSGSFDGAVTGTHWTGTWRNAAGGGALPFALEQTRDALVAVSGRFKCSGGWYEKGYGATYTSSVDLTLAKGAVKAFYVARDMSSKQNRDEQSCSISLADFSREKTDEGILLRAKGDAHPDDANDQHCTVRIIGAGDYFVVLVGDTSDSNNDCRGSADTVFCSARGMWSDVIVDRKTQKCLPVR